MILGDWILGSKTVEPVWRISLQYIAREGVRAIRTSLEYGVNMLQCRFSKVSHALWLKSRKDVQLYSFINYSPKGTFYCSETYSFGAQETLTSHLFNLFVLDKSWHLWRQVQIICFWKNYLRNILWMQTLKSEYSLRHCWDPFWN